MIKNISLLLGILVLRCLGQSPAACMSGTWMCGTTNFSIGVTNTASAFPNSLAVSNPSSNPQGVNIGCTQSGAPLPYWFFFTAVTSGSLGFSMGDVASGNSQVGYYDWNLWMYSPTACSDIYANTLPPLSCNWNAAASGGTGMGSLPQGANSGNFQPSIWVNAGDSFVLLVSNYSGVNAMVTFSSTGTAVIGCISTGLEDALSQRQPRLFPNPANDVLHIVTEARKRTSVNIYSSHSELIKHSESDLDQVDISLQGLCPGLYFVEVRSEEGTRYFTRLLKE